MKGVPFISRGYTKGVPFLCRKGYQRVMRLDLRAGPSRIKLEHLPGQFQLRLIGNSTKTFLTDKLWRVLKFWYTAKGPEQEFRRWLVDELNQRLVNRSSCKYFLGNRLDIITNPEIRVISGKIDSLRFISNCNSYHWRRLKLFVVSLKWAGLTAASRAAVLLARHAILPNVGEERVTKLQEHLRGRLD